MSEETKEMNSELFCRCDLDERGCASMRGSGGCHRESPGFRTEAKAIEDSAIWESATLGMVEKLLGDPSPESAESAQWDEADDSAEIADSGVEAFPVHCLPSRLRKMAEEVAKAERVPVTLTATAALGAVAAAIGGGLVLQSGPHRQTYPNLFILAAAKSGTGKGRAFTMVVRPLLEIEEDRLTHWKATQKPTLEARLTVARKALSGIEKRAEKAGAMDRDGLALELADVHREIESLTFQLKEPVWFVADATREALADALSRGSREALASLSPEARGVVDVLGGRYREGSSDEDIYLSAYSVEPFTVNRIGRAATHLSSPCLTVMWFVQPDILMGMFGKEAFTESGLLPRFLVFDSKAEPELIPEIL